MSWSWKSGPAPSGGAERAGAERAGAERAGDRRGRLAGRAQLRGHAREEAGDERVAVAGEEVGEQGHAGGLRGQPLWQ